VKPLEIQKKTLVHFHFWPATFGLMILPSERSSGLPLLLPQSHAKKSSRFMRRSSPWTESVQSLPGGTAELFATNELPQRLQTLVLSDHRDYGLRNVADLVSDSCFRSWNEPGQSLCWDCPWYLKSRVIHTLADSNWTEIDPKTDSRIYLRNVSFHIWLGLLFQNRRSVI
jgi:hypothetical protein